MNRLWRLIACLVILALACGRSASGGVPEPTPVEQISGQVLKLAMRGDYYYVEIEVDDGETLEYRVDRHVVKVLSVGAYCVFEIYNPTSFVKEDVHIDGATCELRE